MSTSKSPRIAAAAVWWLAASLASACGTPAPLANGVATPGASSDAADGSAGTDASAGTVAAGVDGGAEASDAMGVPDGADAASSPDGNDVASSPDGSDAVPCLQLLPGVKVPFGSVLVGGYSTKDLVAKNCGSAELEIYAIEFAAGTISSEFSLDFTKILQEAAKVDAKNANLEPTGPTKAKPLFIPKNASVPVTVKYAPTDVSPEDPATQAPKPDVSVVQFTANAVNAKNVIVEGFGVNQLCPQAKVVVQEGLAVVPQTPLHLKGDGSVAPNGTVKKYKWTVMQPPGSNQPLVPNANFPNPTLIANVAGVYVFVWTSGTATT